MQNRNKWCNTYHDFYSLVVCFVCFLTECPFSVNESNIVTAEVHFRVHVCVRVCVRAVHPFIMSVNLQPILELPNIVDERKNPHGNSD